MWLLGKLTLTTVNNTWQVYWLTSVVPDTLEAESGGPAWGQLAHFTFHLPLTPPPASACLSLCPPLSSSTELHCQTHPVFLLHLGVVGGIGYAHRELRNLPFPPAQPALVSPHFLQSCFYVIQHPVCSMEPSRQWPELKFPAVILVM